MLENSVVVCNPFNEESLKEVMIIKLEVEVERGDLELLRFSFSHNEYKSIENLLYNLDNFSNKYLSYIEKFGIENKKINFNEINRLYQNSILIREEVEYQKESDTDISFEINKIIIDFKDRIKKTINRLIKLEEKSMLYISDICKRVNFNPEIQINELLKKIK